MTVEELVDLFETHEDEFLKDERVEPGRRLHRRPDLHVFLMLDRLVGDDAEGADRDMVSAAVYDEIYLEVTPADVAAKATEEDIVDMIRCGLRYDNDTNSFCMFV
jgi:hypothetical protein